MGTGSGNWLRRRKSPRLCGTLHIRDAGGHEFTVPLRGRAAVLTSSGTALPGYGEVWAVHTTASTAETSLMIVYGRDGAPGGRESGLCATGATVLLDGVRFTWHEPSTPSAGVRIPQPRTPSSDAAPRTEAVFGAGAANSADAHVGAGAANIPRNRRVPAAKTGNTRAEPDPAADGLRSRLRNMVRVVTQSTRR